MAPHTVRWYLKQQDPPRGPYGVRTYADRRHRGDLSDSGDMVFPQPPYEIEGDLRQAWTTICDVTIRQRDGQPVLAVGGKAIINGLFYLHFEDVTPRRGDAFEVVSATTGLEGTFEDFRLPALDAGLQWRMTYDNLDERRDADGDGRWDATAHVVAKTDTSCVKRHKCRRWNRRCGCRPWRCGRPRRCR